MNPEKCIVLVPVLNSITPQCEEGLRQLELRGYPVRRVFGHRTIDMARNQMASDALAEGFAELMWIDPDIAFGPDDVDRLRSHDRPFVAGIHATSQGRLACEFLRKTESVTFGERGDIMEVMYISFGFAYTHRNLYDRMYEELKLPLCNENSGHALVPFFASSAVKDAVGGGWWYLSEDYSFCLRSRKVQVPVLADTSVRIFQISPYPYGWEEAGRLATRHTNYTINFAPKPAPAEKDDSIH